MSESSCLLKGLNLMAKQRNDGMQYLQSYPKLWKWINQCVVCQRIGHKPELPERIEPGVAAQNLRSFFPEFQVNEVGICKHCAANQGVC
jgi:hypothetical protein